MTEKAVQLRCGLHLFEEGVKVCGDGVLRYFSVARFCGNFYFNLRYFGFTRLRGLRCEESLVAVIDDHEVSAVFWDPLICSFSFCFSKPSVTTISRSNSLHSQGPLVHKQALRFLVADLVGLAAFCIISNDTSTGDLRLGCPVIDL